MLKRIEIYGFKSFAEKTILNFESQLNGIVGPNGSGKSNVVDAIKWCLGEQALSHIRCKNAQDVIFAGSESKSMLNYCEVSVVFDNSGGVFPIDFQEVEVTRKLYRSGETEYYINRAPCRLKDIKDLVLNTGLSSTGYAIIPQGKVEFVVTAKPEERRLLFEETAGVSKFKYHREEALRKLERVKLDMARVEDILSYLKDQMSSLESAVKKAKNFQRYKEELQVLECANIVNQVSQIEQKLVEINEAYNNLNQSYAEQVKELANMESRSAQLKLEIGEYEKKYLETKDALAQVETEISLTSQKIEVLKQQIKEAESNILKLNSEMENITNIVKQYEEQVSDLESKKQVLSEQLKQLLEQKLAHQQEYEMYKSQITEKQQLVKEKNKLVMEVAYHRTKVQNDLVSFNHRINNLKIELGSLQKDIELNTKEKEKVEQELLELQKNIEIAAKEKGKLCSVLENTDLEMKNLENLISEKKNLVEKLSREFYSLSSKLDNINCAVSAIPYSLQKVVKYIENNKDVRIFGPVKSMINIREESYSVISSYLGNKLYWFVAETLQDATLMIDHLKKDNIGYATFIIKEKLNEIILPEINESVSQNLSFDPQWEKVVRFLFSGMELNSGIISTEVIFHGGNFVPPEGEENLYQLEVKVKQCGENLGIESNTLKEVSDRYYELASQKNVYLSQISEMEKSLKEIEQTINEKKEYLSAIVEILKTLNNQVEKITTEQVSLDNEIEQYTKQLGELDEQEKTLKAEINNFSEEITHLQSSGVMDNFLKIVSEHSRAEEQYKNLCNEIDIKHMLIRENQARIGAIKTEILEMQNMIENNTKQILSLEQQLQEFLVKRTELSEKSHSYMSLLEQKRSDLENSDSAIKYLLNRKEEIQQQMKNLELEINNETNNKTNYINWLNEKYSLTLDDAKNMYSNVQVDVVQLEKLKKRIETMGAINLAAPEEYVQLEEKYNTLLTQQQDLIKSEQDIKDTIAKINEQISSNFKETFAKVKENFQKLCNILFEGGKADIVLTNEENILDAGIDIIVQPPGKKLQNINLLSGGEKSIVAIALLFAFFMVKPSPLCILDEVDAPLDEANVVRFVKLLKEFSKSTRFVIITHITRTMESLENIYGVTMEELGVSKIISLKLQKENVEVAA